VATRPVGARGAISGPCVRIKGGGRGVASQASGLPLVETVRKNGPDQPISVGLAPWRKPQVAHDPGKVLLAAGLAVALDGSCLANVSVLRAGRAAFGPAASAQTVGAGQPGSR
jgi:hypothetical protein